MERGDQKPFRIVPQGGPSRNPFFRFYRGGVFLRSYRVEQGTWVFGRDPGSAVVLEDRFVSRRHFQIEFLGENRLYVQDLESANGTRVNGEKIKRAPLAHGDEIQIGDLRIQISHPSFAKARVIEFPVVRTDPNIEVTEYVEQPEEIQLDDSSEASLDIVDSSSLDLSLPEDNLEELQDVSAEVLFDDAFEKAIEVPGAPEILPEVEPARKVDRPAPILPKPTPKHIPQGIEKGVLAAQRVAQARTVPYSKILYVLGMILVSGLMAYGMNLYMEYRNTTPQVSSSTDSKGETKEPSILQPRNRVQKLPLANRKESVAQVQRKPTKRQNRSKVVSVPKAPPKTVKKDSEAVSVLKRSLKGLGGTNFDSADGLTGGIPQQKPRESLQALKEIDRSSVLDRIDVKITMPRSNPGIENGLGSPDQKTTTTDPQKYSALLRERISGVEECYAKNIKDGRSGKISVWLTVGKSGNVRKSGVENSTFKSASFRSCILRRVGSLKLSPPPWEDFTATYSFRFGGARTLKF